jgi:methylmalonyl-CoA mutase N-terminal domain/subunit
MAASKSAAERPGGHSGRRSERTPNAIASARARWEAETLQPALSKTPERRATFSTLGGIPVDRLYAGDPAADTPERVGLPGQYPYTRGIHPTMYRGRVWSMRMFSGFGTPEDTNRRFR